jgi:hypothetical protein
MESDPSAQQQNPLEEPVILKSIDEQIEEEERARSGTVKMVANGPILSNNSSPNVQVSP